jgi:hypothetical protein
VGSGVGFGVGAGVGVAFGLGVGVGVPGGGSGFRSQPAKHSASDKPHIATFRDHADILSDEK